MKALHLKVVTVSDPISSANPVFAHQLCTIGHLICYCSLQSILIRQTYIQSCDCSLYHFIYTYNAWRLLT